jgi:hypothetical protein
MAHLKRYSVSNLAHVQKRFWHPRRSCLCTVRLTTNEVEQDGSGEFTIPLLDGYGYEREPALASLPYTYRAWSCSRVRLQAEGENEGQLFRGLSFKESAKGMWVRLDLSNSVRR